LELRHAPHPTSPRGYPSDGLPVSAGSHRAADGAIMEYLLIGVAGRVSEGLLNREGVVQTPRMQQSNC